MTKRSYKIGHNREQVSLLPPCIEDYVGRDNPVRAIDSYVGSLDLNKPDFCDVGSEGIASQSPYDPANLRKLYLYGYLNQVRSSRRLEREARRNTEVIWLLRGLTPGYRRSPISARTTRPGCERPIASLWCWPAVWTCWAASLWRSTARSFTATPAKPAS
jgi:transposase